MRLWYGVLVLLMVTGAWGQEMVLRHKVTRNQTVSEVARMYGITEEALLEANPGSRQYGLIPGSEVFVAVAYGRWPKVKAQPGDTLLSIGRMYGVPLEQLYTVNRTSDMKLKPGQEVIVPRARLHAVLPPMPTSTTPLPSNGKGQSWTEVQLADGTRAYIPVNALIRVSPIPLPGDKIVEIARRFHGVPYVWGGANPVGGWDCSGFVQEVFRLCGHALPRTADVQFEATVPVPPDKVRPGDLVFFETYAPGASHVGIYVGDGRFIHSSSGRGVVESELREEFYTRCYLGARRLRSLDR